MMLGRETEAAASASTASLEDREVRVLTELAREGEAKVAFQGLRRKLELHQEALARTLRRLERHGLVAHDEAGYRLTEQGFAALRGRPVAQPPESVLPVMEALLPPHLGPEGVAEHLARRWFRGLRWFGQSEAPGELTLTWLAEPSNAKVRVRVAHGSLTLEVEGAPRAQGSGFAAARGVLAALAELYGIPPEEDAPVGAFAPSPGYAA